MVDTHTGRGIIAIAELSDRTIAFVSDQGTVGKLKQGTLSEKARFGEPAQGVGVYMANFNVAGRCAISASRSISIWNTTPLERIAEIATDTHAAVAVGPSGAVYYVEHTGRIVRVEPDLQQTTTLCVVSLVGAHIWLTPCERYMVLFQGRDVALVDVEQKCVVSTFELNTREISQAVLLKDPLRLLCFTDDDLICVELKTLELISDSGHLLALLAASRGCGPRAAPEKHDLLLEVASDSARELIAQSLSQDELAQANQILRDLILPLADHAYAIPEVS